MIRPLLLCVLLAGWAGARLLHGQESFASIIGQLPSALWAAAFNPFYAAGDFITGFIGGLRHAPVDPDSAQLTRQWAAWAACAFWFFPVARVKRMIGIYDPFDKSRLRLSRLLWPLVQLADAYNKRLFGTRKTGGWS